MLLFNILQDCLDEDHDGGKYREFPVEMDLNKTEMLLLFNVRYSKIAERLTVCVKQARNLLLHDKKGKLGRINHSFNILMS